MAAPNLSPALRYSALYVRVSTTDQGERYSPGSQKEKLLAMAAAEGYEVRPEHIIIDMHTGKETARPGLEKVRALVRAGAVQAVFVLCLDRLTRKVYDAAMMAAEFKRHGCRLDFVEWKNDDSPEGRLQFHIMAGMAEYMGEKIVERGKDGRLAMILENRIPGGPPLYGHKMHPTLKGKRILHEAEAQVVREMFELARAGHRCYAIALIFNERGIRSKGYNGNPPALWSRRTVCQLLQNRGYIGEYRTGDSVIEVPRVVSDELFFAVQARLEATAKQWVGRPSKHYLFRNFLYCGICGHRCVGTINGANKRFYRCGHKSNKPPQRRICLARGVSSPALEAAAWKLIWAMLKDPARLLSQARAYFRSLPKPERAKGAGLESELARLRKAEANKKKMLKAGMLDYEEEQAGMLEMKRRIAFLEAELSAIAPVLQLPDEQVVVSYLQEITTGDEPDTYDRRRVILEGLDELRMVYANGEIEITGKVPIGSPSASTTSGDKNGQRRLTGGVNSTRAIPFILKGRVA